MISKLLYERFIGRKSLRKEEEKSRILRLEGYASTILNILLFALKLFVGIISGSIALMADAIHTLSDVLSSVVVIISSYYSAQPADRKHPFGHGRSESVAAIVVAVLLGVAGLEFFKSALERLWNPQSILVNTLVIITIILSIVLKEWNTRFALFLARKVSSEALKADAYHHRSDALSSIMVLIGVGGSYAGYLWLDGAVGVVLAVFIVWAGIRIAKNSMNDILGQAPDPQDLERIDALARSVGGVKGVHDIIVHNYGNQKVVSLHVEVAHTMTLDKAHAISEEVEELVQREMDYFTTVHVDPLDLEDPKIQQLGVLLNRILSNTPVKLKNVHDIRLRKGESGKNLSFDLVPVDALCQEKARELEDFFLEQVKKEFPDVSKVIIQFEPLFTN